MAAEMLKEFVVALGAQVETAQFNKLFQTVKSAKVSIAGIAKVSAAFGGAIAAGAVATYKWMKSMSDQDRELNKTASELKKTKEEALAYNTALKTLGVTADDLKNDKVLQAEFDRLYNQGLELGRPDGMDDALQTARGLLSEFNQLKVTGSYALQYIGSAAMKYAAEPIKEIRKQLKDLREKLIQNLPRISEKVGKAFSVVARLFKTILRAGKDFVSLLEKTPKKLKTALGVGTGLLALVKMGPIGWALMALGMILLLLDDYYTYMDLIAEGASLDEINEKTAFGGLWESLEKFKESDTFADMKQSVDNLLDSFTNIKDVIKEALDNLAEFLGYDSATSLFFNLITGVFDGLANAVTGLCKVLESVIKLLTGDFEGAGEAFTQGIAKIGEALGLDELNSVEDEYRNRFLEQKNNLAQQADFKKENPEEYEKALKIKKQKLFEEAYEAALAEGKGKYSAGIDGIVASSDASKFAISGQDEIDRLLGKTSEAFGIAGEQAEEASPKVKEFGDTTEQVKKHVNNMGSAITTFNSRISNLSPTLPSGAAAGTTSAAGFSTQTGTGHALGGVFSKEHTARIAEGGKPEAVIPLDKTARSLNLFKQAAKALGVGIHAGRDSLTKGAQTGMHNLKTAATTQSSAHSFNASVNAPTTINVYGSEPYATAQAVKRTQTNRDGVLLRNIKGVMA